MTERRARPGAAGVLAAGLLFAGCDLSFRHDDGDTVVEGHARATQRGGGGLGLRADGGPAPGGILATRRDGEIRLPFTAPLDPGSAREAIRVTDETRGDALVPVRVEVRGADAVLRSARTDGAEGGFRPGARLRIEVAGMPSLRALRAADGSILARTAVLHADVREGLRSDRVAPRLLASEPADGARGIEPAGTTVVLRFSEPLHPRTLAHEGEGRRAPFRVTADGEPVRFRVVADHSRSVVTLMPTEGLPGGATVLVELTGRVRDAGGNPLADDSPRRVAFATAGTPGPGLGWIVEPFADASRRDAGGTTVPWADPTRPGVLAGLHAPQVLEVEGRGPSRPFSLDPVGGQVRILLPAAALGDEVRLLRGLRLRAVPGGGGGRILDPVVRLAPTPGLLLPEVDGEPLFPWQTVYEEPGGVGPRGPEEVYFLPFRTPFRHDGIGDLLVELSWSGAVGGVVLKGAETGQPAMLIPWAPEPVRFTLSLRFEGSGERTVARSLWMDSGAARPLWREPRVRPAADPGRVRVLLQGAPSREGGEGPDAHRATPWTEDPADLDGMRWIRFRVEFPDPDPFAPAVVDDLAIPFHGR